MIKDIEIIFKNLIYNNIKLTDLSFFYFILILLVHKTFKFKNHLDKVLSPFTPHLKF